MIEQKEYTRYEVARILGARALQIAMDAPLLLNISDTELKEMKYDSLRIAEREFESGVLPISVKRPFPKKREDKLRAIKDETVADEKIIEKAKEIEKEIKESAEELGFANEDDQETSEEGSGSNVE